MVMWEVVKEALDFCFCMVKKAKLPRMKESRLQSSIQWKGKEELVNTPGQCNSVTPREVRDSLHGTMNTPGYLHCIQVPDIWVPKYTASCCETCILMRRLSCYRLSTTHRISCIWSKSHNHIIRINTIEHPLRLHGCFWVANNDL